MFADGGARGRAAGRGGGGGRGRREVLPPRQERLGAGEGAREEAGRKRPRAEMQQLPPLTPPVIAGSAALAALVAWGVRRRYEADWERSLEKVSHGVVVLRVSSVLAFDMNDRGFSVATGFIVDRTLGIIMTNRHVVTTGPVTADAVLFNKEEVELTPLYADPEHDFGFFLYNPADVKFLRLHQIPLAPSAARVGLEVRVVGNDAGEKISILSGTIARLDRAAPSYGPHTYNDFNTFYYSCASNTSGGSSGSPVINSTGQAVALNAGTSTKSASSYYLPLDRPVRALRLLQKALRAGIRPGRSTVPRGTIGTVLVHRAFGELGRLGLRRDTEAAVRRALPRETGMLVIDQVVPGGPAQGKLEPGDVLVAILAATDEQAAAALASSEDSAPSNKSLDGATKAPHTTRKQHAVSPKHWCTTFIQVDELLDERPGRWVCVKIQRGGVDISVYLRVADLHAFHASAVLEVGGCTLHPLSYQQARNWNIAPGGVIVAFSGYMLSNANVPSRAVLTELNTVKTPDLDTFTRVLLTLPDGARVPIRYILPYAQHVERVAVITIERTWFAGERYELDESTGCWRCTTLPPPPLPPPPVPQEVSFAVAGPHAVRAITPSIVRVFFDIPYQIDGVAALQYAGAGLVVDAAKGLVLVDRNTVPVALGNARIEFASTVEVPADVFFLHPTHNVALVKYNPAHLMGASVSTAKLSDHPLRVGDECMFVGLSKLDAALPLFQACAVRETCIMEVGVASVPRFRAVNEEVVRFDLGLALEDTIGGVFVDAEGKVQAIWAAYCNCSADEDFYEQFEGMPVGQLLPIIAACSVQVDSNTRQADLEKKAKAAFECDASSNGKAKLGSDPTVKFARADGAEKRVSPARASSIPRLRPRTVISPAHSPVKKAEKLLPNSARLVETSSPTQLPISPRAYSAKPSEVAGPTLSRSGHASCSGIAEMNVPEEHLSTESGLSSTVAYRAGGSSAPMHSPTALNSGISPLACSHAAPPLPGLYFLDAELRPLSLSTACGSTAGAGLGLSREWANIFAKCEGEKRQVLSVLRVVPNSPAHGRLHEGDLLLSVNDTPVNTFAAVEAAVLRQPRVKLIVLRDAVEMVIEIATSQIRSESTMHIAVWCGLLLQHPYRDVLERGFVPPGGGIYVSFYLFGSPAHKYKLVPKHWVLELNGEHVNGLSTFLDVARKLPHGASVRLKTCDLNGKVAMYTVKTDHNYWRGYEVFANDGKWVLRGLNEPRPQ